MGVIRAFACSLLIADRTRHLSKAIRRAREMLGNNTRREYHE